MFYKFELVTQKKNFYKSLVSRSETSFCVTGFGNSIF